MNTKRYSYMEENVNQTEKEMAENEKQNLFRAVSLIFGTDLWFFGSDNA